MMGPKVIGKSSAPNYSILGRSLIGSFCEDLCKVSGSRGARVGGWCGVAWCGVQHELCSTLPLAQTPGPCNYRAVDSNVYKTRAPQFSMLARNMLPGDNTQKPGPGTYSPEKVRGEKGCLGCPGRGAGHVLGRRETPLTQGV